MINFLNHPWALLWPIYYLSKYLLNTYYVQGSLVYGIGQSNKVETVLVFKDVTVQRGSEEADKMHITLSCLIKIK